MPSNKDPSSLFQIHGQRTMHMIFLKSFKIFFPVLTECENMAIVDKWFSLYILNLFCFFSQTKTQILAQTPYVLLYDYYINPQEENKFSIQMLSQFSYILA